MTSDSADRPARRASFERRLVAEGLGTGPLDAIVVPAALPDEV